jgi:hypothetical protein
VLAGGNASWVPRSARYGVDRGFTRPPRRGPPVISREGWRGAEAEFGRRCAGDGDRLSRPADGERRIEGPVHLVTGLLPATTRRSAAIPAFASMRTALTAAPSDVDQVATGLAGGGSCLATGALLPPARRLPERVCVRCRQARRSSATGTPRAMEVLRSSSRRVCSGALAVSDRRFGQRPRRTAGSADGDSSI